MNPGLPIALGEHWVFYVLKKILVADTLLLLWTAPPSSKYTNIQNTFFHSMLSFFYCDSLVHQIKSVDRIFFEVKSIQFVQIMLLLDWNCLKVETLSYLLRNAAYAKRLRVNPQNGQRCIFVPEVAISGL